LQKLKIPRSIAAGVIYCLALILLGWVIYAITPIFIIEMQQLIKLFPIYFAQIAPFLANLGFNIFQNLDVFLNAIQNWLINASSSIAGSLASIFGSIFSAIAVFTIAFFFSLDEEGIEKFIRLIIPKRHEQYALNIWNKSQIKVSGWFVIRVAVMFLVGVLTSLSCYALKINYPVLLGFIAGILDIIPLSVRYFLDFY